MLVGRGFLLGGQVTAADRAAATNAAWGTKDFGVWVCLDTKKPPRKVTTALSAVVTTA